MAGHSNGDNFFDDDFDDISQEALLELENNAIQFTQGQKASTQVPMASSDYGDEFEEEDLDDAIVIDESRSTPAINPAFQYGKSPQTKRNQCHPPPSNSNLTSRQRPAIPPPPQFNQTSRLSQLVPIPQHESMLAEQGSQPFTAPDDQVESLRKQIEELVRERNALRDDVNSKAGEIAIVRSKQETKVKEFERELIATRKLSEDKAAKLQKELDKARLSAENAATERDFLKLDAAEAERSRRMIQDKAADKDAEKLTTPKKTKLFAHRDGFEDDEIEIISPSKNSSSYARRTTSSPSKPGKRKRKAVESPARPLEVINLEDPQPEPNQPLLDEAIMKKLAIHDDRFDFLGVILDHRIDSKHARTIEELGKYKLPSRPIESLQSTILGKLPTLGYRKPAAELPVEFCNVVISLWSSCLAELYLDPIYLFVDLLNLALELKTIAIAPHIVDNLVPLIMETVDKLVIRRFQRKPLPQPYVKHIDTTACFSLLYLVALGCMCEYKHIARFWGKMRYDMTIILFHPEQLTADTELMLKLLSTSVFKDRFGSPMGDEGDDSLVHAEIMNYITQLLVEVPTRPQSTEPVTTDVIYKLRVQILQLMTGMTRSPFASRIIVNHKFAIGRLAKLISDELDVLYDYKPNRLESSRIISLATRLLYHIVTKYDDEIDIQKKLSVIQGGMQKYLLCLARLNFSEDDLILESGIDPDVAACAVEMLELVVTPEEGDSIHSAFSSQ